MAAGLLVFLWREVTLRLHACDTKNAYFFVTISSDEIKELYLHLNVALAT